MKFEIDSTEIDIDISLITESEDEIQRQLQKYRNGEQTQFELEINFPDSFTGEVMKEMNKIPYGETRSYGDIADSLDSSAVAIGQACGRNPIPIIIPCHRVVGADSIGGYAYGEDLKRKLLSHESDF